MAEKTEEKKPSADEAAAAALMQVQSMPEDQKRKLAQALQHAAWNTTLSGHRGEVMALARMLNAMADRQAEAAAS